MLKTRPFLLQTANGFSHPNTLLLQDTLPVPLDWLVETQHVNQHLV